MIASTFPHAGRRVRFELAGFAPPGLPPD